MITLSRWNPAELHGPLLPDLLHRNRAHYVPVENKQVMHLYKNAPRSWRTYRLKQSMIEHNAGLRIIYRNYHILSWADFTTL